jgi:hypothetical protein
MRQSMRRLIFPIVFFIVITFVLFQLWNSKKVPNQTNVMQKEKIVHQNVLTKTEEPTITFGGITYSYPFFIISDVKNISLLSNFTDKLLSSELAKNNGCVQYINGNFYDTSDRPLGLWKNGSTILRNALSNRTFNGFFSVNLDNSTSIGFDEPENAGLALQSGPMLIAEALTLPLKIQNDEGARRMIVAKGRSQMLIFISVYHPDSTYQGPTLTDLPDIVEAIGDKEAWSITDAINLDGGSASAFSNGTTTLQELSPIGSMICITP